jgi:hypothetical protein
MRVEAILWSLVVVYFALMGVVYIAFGGEPAGIVLLFGGAGLGGLVAGWTWDWTRRNAPRVEDQAETDASDLSGIIGIYPTTSLRPIALAFGTASIMLGIAIGSWLSMIGLAVVASQVLLLVRDTDT